MSTRALLSGFLGSTVAAQMVAEARALESVNGTPVVLGAPDKPNRRKAEARLRKTSSINLDKRERRIEKKQVGARQLKKLVRAQRELQRDQQAKLHAAENLEGLAQAPFSGKIKPPQPE